jgi:hypothetical protein
MLVKVAPNTANAAGGLRVQFDNRGLGREAAQHAATFSESSDVA